ncbi:aldo/keto reductase [bacterium K02(2017)]|nr:aldo/keto reductase [bacterium K02(2017)]
MKYQKLGQSDLKVSSLCFGTMTFADGADKKESAALYQACRDAGINFFDCANVYAGGESEKYLGDFVKEHRSEVVLTSKAYFPTGAGADDKGTSKVSLFKAINQSLARLKTDYIDLYFLHRFDENTPLIETLEALDDLVKQGKVRYTGVSNFAAWQIAKSLGLSALNDWASFQCIQPMYNLVKRQVEVEILPLAMSENIGVMPYSPLGGGLLSGKYGRHNKSENIGRLNQKEMYIKRYGAEWMYEVALHFCDLAQELKVNPVSLAISWVMANPAVSSTIIGARRVDQLLPALKSCELKISDSLYQKISALSPAPAPATDRNDEL